MDKILWIAPSPAPHPYAYHLCVNSHHHHHHHHHHLDNNPKLPTTILFIPNYSVIYNCNWKHYFSKLIYIFVIGTSHKKIQKKYPSAKNTLQKLPWFFLYLDKYPLWLLYQVLVHVSATVEKFMHQSFEPPTLSQAWRAHSLSVKCPVIRPWRAFLKEGTWATQIIYVKCSNYQVA